MDRDYFCKYLKIEEELNSFSTHKLKKQTRKRYKRYCLKVIRVLLENNINVNSIKSIKSEHLKLYVKIMLRNGRNIDIIIAELRGAIFWYKVANNGYSYTRYKHLIDLKILKKICKGEDKNEDRRYGRERI